MACTFCKSEQIVIKTPYVKLGRSGHYEHETTFCCKAQEANNKYREKRFLPDQAPDLEDIAKG